MLNDSLDRVLGQITNIAKRDMGNIPTDATFSVATNSVLITSTSLQAIATAPATGYSLWVLSVTVSNPTASETPIITLQDTTGTPITFAIVAPGASSVRTVEFKPPIQIATAKGLQGKADSSVGDVTVVAQIATGVTPT